MRTYDISRPPELINIGFDGENKWRPKGFNCAGWLKKHPDGIITLWVQPEGVKKAFPVSTTKIESTIVWYPLSEELYPGTGKLQLTIQDGEYVGKSDTINFEVNKSLVSGGVHPDSQPSWATKMVDDVTAQADRAAEAAERAEQASGEEVISEAVENYFEEHPVVVEETDPTVPAWAKQPTKPTYTAQEVGALPSNYTPPVTSVNGKTGAVVLDAEDVGALSSLAYLPAHAEAFRSSSPSYSEIISAWDSLASDFPNHIEKASIGQDSGGNTIYAYTIKSGTDGALDWVKPMPENRKVIWLSGIHGHEITVPYDDFVFFNDLVRCHGENPTLQWLWDHITFVVVPAICPWGLDHGVRVNANGVNLNRNFPASSWELSGEGTNDYSGASAGSEAETQAIMSLVNANKDALFALNRHTMNAFTPTSRYAYISSLLDDDHEAAFGVFKSLDGICKSKFDVFADMKLSRNLFAVCDSTATGTLDQWFNESGVRGFLLELSPYFNAENFPDATAVLAQNVNATVMGNLVSGFTQAAESPAEEDEDALPQLEWEAGVVSNRGSNLDNAYRIRTTEAVQLPVGTTVTVDADYEFKVNTYSAWESASSYTMQENGTFGTSFRVTEEGLYYRFSMKSADGAKRVSEDIPGAVAHFKMKEPGYTTEAWVQQQGYLTQHQSLANYRTASAQDTIDAAQDTAIAGKYTKPSTGIPASDLASAVQTSLGKADTALQQHQSLSGYATESWVQQQGYLTQHQDISGKADKIPRIAKASTDTTAEIEPNKLYVFPEMASLTITLAAITDNTIVNEYHFIFESGATATTTTFPAIPGLDDFAAETNTAYEVSILEGRALVTSWEVTV